jgi:hypothetical protein
MTAGLFESTGLASFTFSFCAFDDKYAAVQSQSLSDLEVANHLMR